MDSVQFRGVCLTLVVVAAALLVLLIVGIWSA